jgi:bifunctional DNA-binding transcriptional regulator/antitoxin component of YhaV-PrlF toxin-antitoxin module
VPKTKLQKQITRKIGDKEYSKYTIVIPSKIISQLQWAEGDQLIPTAEGKALRIKKAR